MTTGAIEARAKVARAASVSSGAAKSFTEAAKRLKEAAPVPVGAGGAVLNNRHPLYHLESIKPEVGMLEDIGAWVVDTIWDNRKKIDGSIIYGAKFVSLDGIAPRDGKPIVVLPATGDKFPACTVSAAAKRWELADGSAAMEVVVPLDSAMGMDAAKYMCHAAIHFFTTELLGVKDSAKGGRHNLKFRAVAEAIPGVSVADEEGRKGHSELIFGKAVESAIAEAFPLLAETFTKKRIAIASAGKPKPKRVKWVCVGGCVSNFWPRKQDVQLQCLQCDTPLAAVDEAEAEAE